MFQFFAEVLLWIGGTTFDAYQTAASPDQQRTTIGCGVLMLLAFGMVVLWILLRLENLL